MTDAAGQQEEEHWYTPTWGKFAIGLATIGVGVGIFFIVDNNVDRDEGLRSQARDLYLETRMAAHMTSSCAAIICLHHHACYAIISP